MPRKTKPDDPDWIVLSANQKQQIRAAMRQLAKTRHLPDAPIPNSPTPAKVQVEALRAYHRDGGPHINFTGSVIAQAASEAFRKIRLRKLN